MSPELEEFYADLAASQEPPITTNDSGERTDITVDEVLSQRGSRYGSFKSHAELSQALQHLFYSHMMNSTGLQNSIPPYMIESLNMIFHKLARIANGDPFYDDSWRDIAGYSQLVVDILHGKNT